VAGIDIIAQDIGRPLEEQGGAIIEVNAGPGLQMHLAPESGQPRPVGEAIVDTLFASGEDGRIPLVAVSGTQHTLAVSKLIGGLLTQRGHNVALASAEGSFVGETRVRGGDARTAEAAASALLNPTVDAAVFEMSVDDILTAGLGFDLCRVAVLTAMGEGPRLDFAEWDTPHKKSLVYRATSDMVLKNGAVVLSAGEPLGSLIIEHCPAPAILVSTEGDHDDIRRQRATGGRAVVVRGGQVTLISGSEETPLGLVANGMAPEVVLPAVATLWALETPVDWLAAVITKLRAS
jgi:cyanophycin synthetase